MIFSVEFPYTLYQFQHSDTKIKANGNQDG